MATKKYTVRTGFVAQIAIAKNDGTSYLRTYGEGEEVALEDADAAQHLHKLEFSSQKDRDAALAAEQQAKVAAAAGQSPAELVQQLIAALAQAQAAAAPTPAPASA